jgi:phosphoribosylanthranilate isomerase
MTLVKICGVQDEATALAAAEAGADYLGLVFAPSRRKVDADRGKMIAAAVCALDPRPLIVGVFVNQPLQEVESLSRVCGLDLVQLSGDESWQYCSRLSQPIVKALHISPETGPADLLDRIDAGRRALGDRLIFLLDTKAPDHYGGTGRQFDWRRLKDALTQSGVLVAGGLDASNVAALIRDFNPWGVDVSSGVETAGRKDIAKIRAFIQLAKARR